MLKDSSENRSRASQGRALERTGVVHKDCMATSWNWLPSAEEWGPPAKHYPYVTEAEPLRARYILPRRRLRLRMLRNEPRLSQFGTGRTRAYVRSP